MKFTNTITDENGRLIDVRVEEGAADKRRGGGLQEFRETPGGIRQLKSLQESSGTPSRQPAAVEVPDAEVEELLKQSFERLGFSESGVRAGMEGRCYPVTPSAISTSSAPAPQPTKALSEANKREAQQLDALLVEGFRRMGVSESAAKVAADGRYGSTALNVSASNLSDAEINDLIESQTRRLAGVRR